MSSTSSSPDSSLIGSKRSGGDIMEVPYVHVINLEGGKVQRVTNYEDTALDQQLIDE